MLHVWLLNKMEPCPAAITCCKYTTCHLLRALTGRSQWAMQVADTWLMLADQYHYSSYTCQRFNLHASMCFMTIASQRVHSNWFYDFTSNCHACVAHSNSVYNSMLDAAGRRKCSASSGIMIQPASRSAAAYVSCIADVCLH
jgi:hypothetical protein